MAWELPTKVRKKAPQKGFTLGRIKLVSRGKRTSGFNITPDTLLAYEVEFQLKPHWVHASSPYENRVRKIAYRWFVYECGEEITRLVEESEVKLSIKIGYPHKGRVLCKLVPDPKKKRP